MLYALRGKSHCSKTYLASYNILNCKNSLFQNKIVEAKFQSVPCHTNRNDFNKFLKQAITEFKVTFGSQTDTIENMQVLVSSFFEIPCKHLNFIYTGVNEIF